MVEHRVDDERIYGYVLAGVHDSLKGIEKQESSEPLSLKFLINSKPAQNAGGYGVFGQASSEVGREIVSRNT